MAPKMDYLLFTILVALGCGAVAGGLVRSVPAIYVFGDSLADVGNNNYVPGTTAKANFPHYGIDFSGEVPTGRFSNGYNGIDYIAKMVGFSQSPPPFLSLKNETQMLQGVNFASGSSGILDTTGTAVTLTTQIMDFEVVAQALRKKKGDKSESLISKSLFLISTGSNDVFNYYSRIGHKNTTTNQKFIASLLHKFEDHLKTLYKLGARKYGILGLGHIGCIPYLRSTNPSAGCTEELNGMARRFNTAAKARLRHLSSTLEGMKYSYANTYDFASVVQAKPYLFGYKELKSACCGLGRFNGASACTPTSTYCSNREDHFFWDFYHPTQATYKLTAMWAYSGSRKFATPINIKHLAI